VGNKHKEARSFLGPTLFGANLVPPVGTLRPSKATLIHHSHSFFLCFVLPLTGGLTSHGLSIGPKIPFKIPIPLIQQKDITKAIISTAIDTVEN